MGTDITVREGYCLTDKNWNSRFVSEGFAEIFGLNAAANINILTTLNRFRINFKSVNDAFNTLHKVSIENISLKNASQNSTYRITFQKTLSENTEPTYFIGITEFLSSQVKAAALTPQPCENAPSQLYRSLFDNMPGNFVYCKIILDENNAAKDFVILETNKAFEKIFNIKKEFIIGRKITELIDLSDKNVTDSLKEILKDVGESAMKMVPKISERYIYTTNKWYSTRIFSYEQYHFAAVLDDITEPKTSEIITYNSKKELENSLNALTSAICILDEFGNIIHTNHAWNESETISEFFLGYDLTNGENYVQLLHNEYSSGKNFVKNIIDGIGELLTQNVREKYYEYEIDEIWYGMKLTSFTSFGKKIIIINENITERKNYETEIKANETRLEALYELNQNAGKDIKYLADYAASKALVLTASRAGFLAFAGNDENDFQPCCWIKSPYEQCTHSCNYNFEISKDNDFLIEAVKRRRTIIINRNLWKTTNAPADACHDCPFIARRYISLPIIENNKIVLVAIVVNKNKSYDANDVRQLKLLFEGLWYIIKHKKANEMLHEANEKLKKLDNTKTNFLTMVSHELRTPLTSILGFAKINKKKLEKNISTLVETVSNPKIKDSYNQVISNFEIISSEGLRLTELINNVLDITKLEAGKIEWNMSYVNMNEVIKTAVESISSLFNNKNIMLTTEIEENLPQPIGDRNRLIQVVINLLSNAYKYTDSGCVKCNTFKNSENEITVKITDTGIGIKKTEQKTIFEKFKQSSDTLKRDNQESGTGLGLALCGEIIKHHDGKIWVESEPGLGSTFFFTLPLYDKNNIFLNNAHDIQIKLKENVLDSLEKYQKNICVIDSDERTMRILRHAIKNEGFTVIESPYPFDAIVTIKNAYQKPDAIIINEKILKESNIDIAAIIKNDPLLYKIPVFIIEFIESSKNSHEYFIFNKYYIW